MLPRVSAALVKFIKPVSVSGGPQTSKDSLDQRRGNAQGSGADQKDPSPDFQKDPSQGKAAPHLKLVPQPGAELTQEGNNEEAPHDVPPGIQALKLGAEEGVDLPPAVLEQANIPMKPSVAALFLELLRKIRGGALMGFFAAQAYKIAQRRATRAGKFRKGTMFDSGAD